MRRKFNATYDMHDHGVSWELHDYTKGVIPVAKGTDDHMQAATASVFAAIRQRIEDTTPPPAEEESEPEATPE